MCECDVNDRVNVRQRKVAEYTWNELVNNKWISYFKPDMMSLIKYESVIDKWILDKYQQVITQ